MDQNPEPNPGQPGKTEEAWREVGRQFESLGTSLAAAFRTAWESESTRQHAAEMRSGLESLARDVSQVIKDTAASPEGQQVKASAKGAAESLRDAGEQTAQEARPHLLNALRQMNAELQHFIDQIEKDKPSG